MMILNFNNIDLSITREFIRVYILIIVILLTAKTSLCLKPEGYFQDDALCCRDYIFKDNIKTVRFHRKGWELSNPMLEMGTDEKLFLSFDDINVQAGNYYYTIVHCNSNWSPSGISPYDYLDGFDEGRIDYYRNSFNTTYDYIHYELTFPNETMRPKISGNYILKVYEDYDRDNVVFTRRFYVVEQKVNITADIEKPKTAEHYDTGQEINFTLNYEGIRIRDPYTEIKVILLQNRNWDNKIIVRAPRYARPGVLTYDFDSEIVFPGLNEFRYFDVKSVRFKSENISNIDFRNPYYHIILGTDKERVYRPYFFVNDLNGKYYVDRQEGVEKHLEADYLYVHFRLDYPQPPPDGSFYVYGGLTDWNLRESNKMEYNTEAGAYELTLLLKQGYYNYHYVFRDDRTGITDFAYIEGSHFETENDYSILVYFRESTARYERLIAYKTINTLE